MPTRTVSTLAIGAPPSVPGLHAAEALALLQAARGSAGAGAWPAARVLDGCHVAVLASSDQHPSAAVFSAAATALGARVARILPADLGLGDASGAAHTARLLGRLYAAIGCAALDVPGLALLQRCCGVPVLHDLAADTHASRLLADLMTLQQALHDAPALPTDRVRLGVYGPARSRLLRAWRQMAAGVGIDVIDLNAPGADARCAGCHFACRPAVPPELLVIDPEIGPGIGPVIDPAIGGPPALPHTGSLADRQRSNHSLVVQALLRNALAARR